MSLAQPVRVRDVYKRVVWDNPGQLGRLYHQDGFVFQNQDLAIQYLTKNLEAGRSSAVRMVSRIINFHPVKNKSQSRRAWSGVH